MPDSPALDSLDLIWGVHDMARIIGRTDRVTFHLVTTGAIPARKIGGRWVIERSALEAVFTGKAA